MNRELPNVQAGFRKGRGTRDQIANIWSSLDYLKSKRVPEKHLLLLYWVCQSLWLCGSPQTVGKFLKRWEYQTTWPASWEIRIQVKKQQLEPDMEQQTGSKLGKKYIKAIYFHPAYLTYMQSTSCEMSGWMKHKKEDCGEITRRNINNLRYADDTTLMAESEEELKSLLMKDESEKVGLKLNIQETKIMASGPITSWQIDVETMETVADFNFLVSKSL